MKGKPSKNEKKGLKSTARHEKNSTLLVEEKKRRGACCEQESLGVIPIQNWGTKAKKKRQTNNTKTMKRKNSKDIKQHTKMKIRYNPAWGRRAQVRTNAPRLVCHIIRTTDFRRNEDECPYPRKARNLERGANGRHIRPKHRHRHKRICGWPR